MRKKTSALVLALLLFGGCGSLSVKSTEKLEDTEVKNETVKKPAILVSSKEEIENFNKSEELEYKISAGDIINLTTAYKTIENTDYIVNVGGNINIEKIGSVNVAERTISEVEKEINTKMAEYYKSEKVILNFKKINNNISVLGEIKSPGLLLIEGKITLLEVIARSGGFNEAKSGKKYYSRVMSSSGKSIVIDLNEILELGNSSQNINLKKGDTVYIFSNEADGNGIYLFGDIAKAGKYEYYDELNLLEAIIIAGGPTKYGKMDKVFVIRTDKEKKVRVYGCELEKILNNKDSKMVYLENKDIIYIGKSMVGNINSAIESILPPLNLTNAVLSPISSINSLMTP